MTKNNMLKKIKNLFYQDTEENVREDEFLTTETSKEVSTPKKTIDTKITENKIPCDCCNQNTILEKSTLAFKLEVINGVETEIPLYSNAVVKYIGGEIIDDVAICDECKSMCDTPEKEKYIWINGMLNRIHSLIDQNESKKEENLNRVQNIQETAEQQIKAILEENKNIDIDSAELALAVENLTNELDILEEQLK